MKILDLDILSADIRSKLVAAGVETLAGLTDLHTSPRRCLELSQETELSVAEIHEIISAALFCQIDKVELEHSSLLVKIGIDSTVKLANSKGDKVLNDMEQFNRLQGEPKPLPSSETIQLWITQAQQLVLHQSDNYES